MIKQPKVEIDQSGQGLLLNAGVSHFITLSENLGSTAIIDVAEDLLYVPIFVNRNSTREKQDFDRLAGRMEFIRPALDLLGIGAALMHAPEAQPAKDSDCYLLVVPKDMDQLFRFTGLLIHDQRPFGWGSSKNLADRIFQDIPTMKNQFEKLCPLLTPLFAGAEARFAKRFSKN